MNEASAILSCMDVRMTFSEAGLPVEVLNGIDLEVNKRRSFFD